MVRFPDRPGPPFYASTMIDQARGRLGDAEATFLRVRETEDPAGDSRSDLAGNLAALRAARGRLAAAESESDKGLAIQERVGNGSEYLEATVQAAWVDVVVRERPAEGRARLEAALERYPLDGLAPLDRPYPRLAEIYARAGDPAHAATLLDEMEREIEPAFLGRSRIDIDRARAEIALAEGSVDEAIALFRRANTGFCYICALPGLSIAYERAGQTDSAIATLTRYAESPYSDRFLSYTYPLGPAIGPAHEHLGALNEEAGNLEEAARNYARFVELWAEADPELQPRVNAAQARLEAIMREIG